MIIYTCIAEFKGQDGSLGYRKGRSYILTVYEAGPLDSFFGHPPIVIKRRDGTGSCPYGSTKKFLENWNVVSTKNREGKA